MNMKNAYISPVIELKALDTRDIITLSVGTYNSENTPTINSVSIDDLGYADHE